MSKTTNTPSDDARVAALENELRLMREQHAAEMQALRDDLRAARERDGRNNMTDALGALIDRVEGTVPQAVFTKDREKADAMHADLDRRILQPYRDALGDGSQPLFFCGLLGYDKVDDGVTQLSPPVPRNNQGRVIAAGNQYLAQAIYERLVGVSKGCHAGKYFDGVSFVSYAAEPSEASEARTELLAVIEAGRDVGEVIRANHKWFVRAHNKAACELNEPVGVS